MNFNDITFFKTAQGSKYIRLPDGRLRRWKSSHANTGGEDMGLHGWSTQSIFVEPKYEHAANSIQYLVGRGYKVALSKDAEGKMFPMIVDGSKWRPATWGDAYTVYAKQNPDIANKVLSWKYSKEPIVGFHVVDFDLKGGSKGTEIKGYHFGSPVSEITPLSDEDKKLFFPSQSNLQESIRKILKEYSLDEVSDEIYDYVKSHPNQRFIMSEEELINFRNEPNQEMSHKPNGLWYAVGSSWIDWVRSEMPEWEQDNVFLVELNPSKIIKISSYDEIMEFTNRYKRNFHGFIMIDWRKVSQDYSGIEISPYISKARRQLNWYYTWDVASGCIWNQDAIKSIKRIEL